MVDKKNESFKENNEDYKKHGFDLYPERRFVQKELTFFDKLSFPEMNKKNCEYNVVRAIYKNPVIKLLIGALRNMGCPFDIKRHIACERCASEVMGGFDKEFNQIVICSNKSSKNMEAALVHELIHMYDYCTAEIDFKNLKHLACTEIRAANLAHCSFLYSLYLRQSSLINVKKTHEHCVKLKAAESMMLATNLPFEEVIEEIISVFDKCYNDLEPIGRRLRKNTSDLLMAYNEAIQIGVCKP